MGIIAGMGYGYGGVTMAILAVLVSTGFLVWMAGKKGAPLQKFAMVIAWIVFFISAISLAGKSYWHTYKWFSEGCYKGDYMGKHKMFRDKMKHKMKRKMMDEGEREEGD